MRERSTQFGNVFAISQRIALLVTGLAAASTEAGAEPNGAEPNGRVASGPAEPLPEGIAKYRGHQHIRFSELTEAQSQQVAGAASAVLVHRQLRVERLSAEPDAAETNTSIEVVLAPDQLAQFRHLTQTVLSEDLSAQFVQELESSSDAAQEFFAAYRSTEEVHAHLQALATAAPRAEWIELGTSTEGRSIPGIRFGTEGAPGILVTGTQHAREWISPMVTTCIAQALSDGDGVDPQVNAALERLEITVVPIVNPDGYEFSRSSDRLWRKNRGTPAVDLNRNWGAGFGIGATTNTNSDVYQGEAAFSEPETFAISRYIQDHPDLQIFLDYHSDAQGIAHPLALSSDPPPNIDDILFIANNMADQISAVHGVEHSVFRTGTRGAVGGLAADYAVDTHGMIAVTVELRRGQGGPFVLDPSLIEATCDENLPAFFGVTEFLLERLPEPPPVDNPGMGGEGGQGAGGGENTGGAPINPVGMAGSGGDTTQTPGAAGETASGGAPSPGEAEPGETEPGGDGMPGETGGGPVATTPTEPSVPGDDPLNPDDPSTDLVGGAASSSGGCDVLARPATTRSATSQRTGYWWSLGLFGLAAMAGTRRRAHHSRLQSSYRS